jgi:hypothetical protein
MTGKQRIVSHSGTASSVTLEQDREQHSGNIVEASW